MNVIPAQLLPENTELYIILAPVVMGLWCMALLLIAKAAF